MESNNKKYYVGEDLAKIKDLYFAALSLRDVAIKIPFCYKKALRASKDAVKYDRLFGEKIRELYPELYGKSFEYYKYEQYVIVKE